MLTKPKGRTRSALAAGLALIVAASVSGCGDDAAPSAQTRLSLASVANSGAAELRADTAGGTDPGVVIATALPTGPSTGQVFRPTSGATTASVQQLAAALGITSPVVEKPGGWIAPDIAATDGLRLIVIKDDVGTWSFDSSTDCDLSQAAPDSASCSVSSIAVPAPAPGTVLPNGSVVGQLTPAIQCTGGGIARPIPDDAARAAVAPVLAALAPVTVAPLTTVTRTNAVSIVSASTTIGGVAVQGFDQTFRVVGCGAGTVTGNGTWANWAADGDPVPLIDANAALARLNSAPQPAIPELCRQAPSGDGCLEPRRSVLSAAPGLMRDLDLATSATVVVPAWVFTMQTRWVDGAGTVVPQPDGSDVATTTAVVAIADSALAPAPTIGAATSDPGGSGSGTAVPGDPGSAPGGGQSGAGQIEPAPATGAPAPPNATDLPADLG